MSKSKIKMIAFPVEEFISMFEDDEKLAIIQSLVDDLGGIEIVFKSNHGSTFLENNAFLMEGRNIVLNDGILEIKAD